MPAGGLRSLPIVRCGRGGQNGGRRWRAQSAANWKPESTGFMDVATRRLLIAGGDPSLGLPRHVARSRRPSRAPGGALARCGFARGAAAAAELGRGRARPRPRGRHQPWRIAIGCGSGPGHSALPRSSPAPGQVTMYLVEQSMNESRGQASLHLGMERDSALVYTPMETTLWQRTKT